MQIIEDAPVSDSVVIIIRLLFDNGEEYEDRVGSHIVRGIICQLWLTILKCFYFSCILVGAAIYSTFIVQEVQVLLLKAEVYFILSQTKYSYQK